MVEVQLLTGMRPGEACRIRPSEIDTSGPVWVYHPALHKNRHRDKPRVIAIGPRARAILDQYTPADPTDYYFSPRRAVEQLHAERTKARETPRYASHLARNARKRVAVPKRAPGACYSVMTYDRAVARACHKARVPEWSPNQLRHSHGTTVRERYGLEAAQVALGHERADVTQVYAERNLALAARVAAEIG
jgi:integrase